MVGYAPLFTDASRVALFLGFIQASVNRLASPESPKT
jgi:hypothetical protein